MGESGLNITLNHTLYVRALTALYAAEKAISRARKWNDGLLVNKDEAAAFSRSLKRFYDAAEEERLKVAQRLPKSE